MNFDLKAFIANHPALKAAAEAMSDAMLKAVEDAALAAIAAIPVVGGIAEPVAALAVDPLEQKIAAMVRAEIETFFLGRPPAPAPVDPQLAAARAALPPAVNGKTEILAIVDGVPRPNPAAIATPIATSAGQAKQMARGQQIADKAAADAAADAMGLT